MQQIEAEKELNIKYMFYEIYLIKEGVLNDGMFNFCRNLIKGEDKNF